MRTPDRLNVKPIWPGTSLPGATSPCPDRESTIPGPHTGHHRSRGSGHQDAVASGVCAL